MGTSSSTEMQETQESGNSVTSMENTNPTEQIPMAATWTEAHTENSRVIMRKFSKNKGDTNP